MNLWATDERAVDRSVAPVDNEPGAGWEGWGWGMSHHSRWTTKPAATS